MASLRIKICGITNVNDGKRAAFLGADAVGLNFYTQSPRCIDFAEAHAIMRALPAFVEPVGIFVNESLTSVFKKLNQLGRIRLIQWHGEQRELSDVYPFRLVAAFSVAEAKHLREITSYLEMCRTLGALPAAVLVDARVPGQHGGTGQKAPWGLLADFRIDVPLILAGGLKPDNVAEAIRMVRPYGVDVASGVESAPGQKDPELMYRFMANAREAAARL